MSRAREVFHDYYSWHRTVRITESASAVAFWLTICFGPAALVAINVLGLVIPQEEIARHLSELAVNSPGTFGDALISQMIEVAKPSPGSWLLDVVLVVASLWTVSTAVSMLLRGLRRGFDRPPISFAVVRILGGVLGLGAIMVVGVIAAVMDTNSAVQRLLGNALGALVGFLLILGLYRLAVGRAIPMRRLWPGALVASIALVVIEVCWERFTGSSPSMSRTYGSLAGIVTSLLALWAACYCVLFGAFITRLVDRRLA